MGRRRWGTDGLLLRGVVSVLLVLFITGSGVTHFVARADNGDRIGVSRRDQNSGTQPLGTTDEQVSPLLSQDGTTVTPRKVAEERAKTAVTPAPAEGKPGFFGRFWSKVTSAVAGAVKSTVNWVVDNADHIAAIAGTVSLVLTVVGTVAMFIPGAQPFAAAALGVARVAGTVAQVASVIGAAKTAYDWSAGKVTWQEALLRLGIEAVGVAVPLIGKGVGKVAKRVAPGLVSKASSLVSKASNMFRKLLIRGAPRGSGAYEAAAGTVVRDARAVAEKLEYAPHYDKNYLQSLGSHEDAVKNSLTREDLKEFMQLAAKRTDELSDDQILKLMEIRDTVPPPTKDTVMQRVILPDEAEQYLATTEGNPVMAGGFMARGQDVAHLDTPEKLFSGMGLNYPETKHAPNSPKYVIRFTSRQANAERVITPYGGITEEHARRVSSTRLLIYEDPFSGHGYVLSRDGTIIPEWRPPGGLKAGPGAEIWVVETGPNSVAAERCIGYYNGERFIDLRG